MKASEIRALNGHVFVAIPHEAPKVGELILNTEERPSQGIVIAVPENDRGLKVGSRVIFKRWSGNDYPVEDISDCKVFTYEEIFATIED